mmetsp:Transcript_38891/g.71412  ORF Transcript_38891/g.71412 Transcript_38891/m.71412 type:complete len:217 (-) Transcript_38891:252-902(-)
MGQRSFITTPPPPADCWVPLPLLLLLLLMLLAGLLCWQCCREDCSCAKRQSTWYQVLQQRMRVTCTFPPSPPSSSLQSPVLVEAFTLIRRALPDAHADVSAAAAADRTGGKAAALLSRRLRPPWLEGDADVDEEEEEEEGAGLEAVAIAAAAASGGGGSAAGEADGEVGTHGEVGGVVVVVAEAAAADEEEDEAWLAWLRAALAAALFCAMEDSSM